MKVPRLAVAAATLCGFLMLRDARAEVSSPSEYATAVLPAALLYRDASASLDTAQSAIKAGEMDKARAALAKAEEGLAQPNTALKSIRRDLEKRASFVEGQLSATTCPAVPVAAAAPAPAQAERKAAPPMALGEAMDRLTAARAGLHGHELSKEDVEIAEIARDVLTAAVEGSKPRMEKDPELANHVQVATELLTDVADDIRLAHLIADFVAGPGAAQKKGMALSQKAGAERDSKKRHAALKEAQDAFQECATDGEKMMSESPVLNRTALFLATSRTSPKKVATACAQQQKALARRIASR
jgi:hypothetical protein